MKFEDGSFVVPRYVQSVARAPKVGRRLQCFLPRQGLILGVDSSCSVGREKRQGCVKELRNRIKSKFSGGGTYRKCGDFSSQARSSFPRSKLLVMQAFKAMGTPGCSEPLAFGDNGS